MSRHTLDAESSSFSTLPHLSDEIRHNVIKSEIEGGVYLDKLSAGDKLEVQTENHLYELVMLAADKAMISGHPEYCPVPIEVGIHGSSWGGSMLKVGFIGRGMRLEFRHPFYKIVTTSPIRDVRAV